MARFLKLPAFPHRWFGFDHPRASSTRPKVSSRRRVRLVLEALEERITPTTYNVTDVASLQNAIISAREDTGPDTIVLAPGQYNLSNQLAIYNSNPNFSLTIKGSGATASDTVIDASNVVIAGSNVHESAFLLLGASNGTSTVNFNATFEDLTIQNGQNTLATIKTDTGGGAIADNGNNLTLNNVVLQNNSVEATATGSTAKGGGVYVYNASLAILDSVIRDNSAFGENAGSSSNDGGDAEGGGIYFEATTALQKLIITNSTIADNIAAGGGGNSEGLTGGGGAFGGGIAAVGVDGATLTFGDSTLSGNSAEGGRGNGPGPGPAKGGGADLNLNSTFINSTIAKNIAISDGSAEGGGVLFGAGSGSASLTNVTVAYNQARGTNGPVVCGGLANDNGSTQRVQLTNSLVALNTAQFVDGAHALDGEDVFGNFLSGGHNLIGNAVGVVGTPFTGPGDLAGTSQNPLNPVIDQLADNGGPTQTIALLPGSPAINAGDNNAQTVTGPFDQRGQGFPRVVNGAIDIGAFEVQPSSSAGGGGGGPSPSPAPPPASPPSQISAALEVAVDVAAILLQGNGLALSQLNQISSMFLGHGLPSNLLADAQFYLGFAGSLGPTAVQAGIGYANSVKTS